MTKRLIEIAKEARAFAFAPFSKFKVGAAILTRNGKIFTGCNVESASYGLTVCAERVAIWKAISEGNHDFVALAIVADTDALTPPCGACRQIIWEFCGNIDILLANLDDKQETLKIEELLPKPFGSNFLR